MAVLPDAALSEFPDSILLPKKEVGAERFINKYPEYDGRRIKIAIFDSGVDPAAKGLQVTTEGERKIVDLIDCSGSGDVNTSTVVYANDGIIQGLSKRKLKIPETWNNPSGKYHVGLKSAYLLFPSRLKERLQKEKKEEEWDKAHNKCQTNALQQLCDAEKQTPSPKTMEERLKIEDCKATVDVLDSLDKKYKDPGPIYDCVVFHNGEEWCACVDTTENGDLSACELLRSFKVSGEYAVFGEKDMLSYSVNIYDDGNILSIVTNCSSHGTHVASIAAGCHPDSPELNGIAPGAQLISMKVGDSKLDSMETGSAIIRALIAAIEAKVDVINMSYGEAAKWPNSGRIVELLHEAVNKHNIVFVTSAGNDGPALSTVGAPSGISPDVIGVSAYVSSEMVQKMYSKLEKMPGKHYGWSSRGPTMDGSLGVCITAPGGAYTSVPKWTLRNTQLMNGTSMSSPNACGGVALLLSGLKAEHIDYSPASIRRCLENTALKIEGALAFSQGQGMLQVDKAFEQMKAESRIWNSSISFKIDCGNQQRGIYIRESYELDEPCVKNVSVCPVFNKKCDNELKLAFDVRVCLVPTVSWISTPTHLALSNSERGFAIDVNHDKLDTGCHFGEVCAYDVAHPGQGPLFRIPVTVIVPVRNQITNNCRNFEWNDVAMKPGQIRRYYISVPKGTTWAEVELQSKDTNQTARYLVHSIQLAKDYTFGQYELHQYATLKPLNGKQMHVKTLGGATMELCIARWWNYPGESMLSFKITFHGLQPSNQEIFLNGCEGFSRVDVSCAVSPEEISPNASLTHYVLPMTPKESKLRPLGERDLVPEGKQIFELVLTYAFSLSKETEVLPIAPLLHDVLYESEYESQFWMIFDQNKKLMKAGDAFPVRNKYTSKLNGSMTLLYQIRHEDKDQLEKLRHMVLNLSVKLNSPISVDCYASRKDIYSPNNRSKFRDRLLQPGFQCPVYLAALKMEKIPKTLKPGHYMTGRVTFAKQEGGKKVDYHPLQYMVPPGKIQSSNAKPNGSTKDEAEIEKNYKDAVQDVVVSWIPKLNGHPLQEEVIELVKDSIHGLNAHLNALDGLAKERGNLEKIITVADDILSRIDYNELVAHVAKKTDLSDDAAKTKIEMDKKKAVLINALVKKGIAIADILTSHQDSPTETSEPSDDQAAVTPENDSPEYSASQVDEIYEKLAQWIDSTDAKTLMFTAKHALLHKHYGRALKALFKIQEDQPPSKLHDQLCINVTKDLGWQSISSYLEQLAILNYPPNYEPF